MTDDFYTRPTAVYRLYDDGGMLLYVGIAHDLATRWRQHRKTKEWWPRVARKAIAWCNDRPSAEMGEQLVIMEEGPYFNRNMPPWRVDDRNHSGTEVRRLHERLVAEVFDALEAGMGLDRVAEAAGWHPLYVLRLGEKRRAPWWRAFVADIRDGKVKG